MSARVTHRVCFLLCFFSSLFVSKPVNIERLKDSHRFLIVSDNYSSIEYSLPVREENNGSWLLCIPLFNMMQSCYSFSRDTMSTLKLFISFFASSFNNNDIMIRITMIVVMLMTTNPLVVEGKGGAARGVSAGGGGMFSEFYYCPCLANECCNSQSS